jgi:TetR/AcrR family transcriptional repressor of lmrAB and yxaGH operons
VVGVFALGAARDTFGKAVRGYFKAWAEALTATLQRLGRSPADAVERAEDILLGIQGALVLARANGDPAIFARALQRLRKRV